MKEVKKVLYSYYLLKNDKVILILHSGWYIFARDTM